MAVCWSSSVTPLLICSFSNHFYIFYLKRCFLWNIFPSDFGCCAAYSFLRSVMMNNYGNIALFLKLGTSHEHLKNSNNPRTMNPNPRGAEKGGKTEREGGSSPSLASIIRAKLIFVNLCPAF